MNYVKPQNTALYPAVSVALSPRYEIFHALRLVLDPVEGVHDQWCVKARAGLSKSFFDRVNRFCADPVIWPNLADAIERSALGGSFFEVLKAQAELDLDRLQMIMCTEAFHSPQMAEDILSGKKSLAETLKKLPAEKKDWLAFLGLYPYDAGAPVVMFFERLIADPMNVRDELLRLLNEFWDRVFEDTWEEMLPSLQRSTEHLEQAVPACSMSEIAARAFVRIEVNDTERYFRSVLGDYTIWFDDVELVHFTPSAFNYNHLWAVYKNPDTDKSTVVFPYFDPTIALSDKEPRDEHAKVVIIEPLLLFKTLGDSTRFAMVRILADQPTTAVDLARRLNVSKATISHHVQKLRVVGLINEEWAAGSVKLSLKRKVIELISDRTIDLLYGPNRKV